MDMPSITRQREDYCSSGSSLPATESIALPENINPTKPPIQNQTGIKTSFPGRVQKPADTKANIDAGTKTLITKTISRTKYFMAPPEEMKFHPKRTKQSGFENPLKYLPAKTLIIFQKSRIIEGNHPTEGIVSESNQSICH